MRHPVQPLEEDEHGVLRFKQNKIVHHLLDTSTSDLNPLWQLHFSNEDHEQLMQLIGYSLSGYGDLDYVSDETYYLAESQLKPPQRIEVLREKYAQLFDLARGLYLELTEETRAKSGAVKVLDKAGKFFESDEE